MFPGVEVLTGVPRTVALGRIVGEAKGAGLRMGARVGVALATQAVKSIQDARAKKRAVSFIASLYGLCQGM